MVDLLSEPPKSFQCRSTNSSSLFDEDGTSNEEGNVSPSNAADQIAGHRHIFSGKWTAHPSATALLLVNRARHLENDSKAKFIGFLQLILCWLSEEWRNAKELSKYW
jgi:hypothetical protein